MVMIPPSSPRKTAGNKYAVAAKQQPYKNASKSEVMCEWINYSIRYDSYNINNIVDLII